MENEIKKVFYGQITSLVDSNKITTNFFKGLHYKKNYEKIFNFFQSLNDLVSNIQIVDCFDYESKDEYISSFRSITINKDEKILKEIQNIEKDKNFYIEKVIVDKKQNTITVLFLE